jgi:hypothetical protein
MTLVINQILNRQYNDNNQTKEAENEETTKDYAMFLWDWCIDLDE